MKMTKEEAYKVLEGSPMFQLSLASKELFHSNFLAWIGSLPNKGEKDHPFKKLMISLGAKQENVENWPDTWYVAREYHNFDLCVLSRIPDEFEDEETEDGEKESKQGESVGNNNLEKINVLLVLENKVKSIPYIGQLHEYQDKIVEQNFHLIQEDQKGQKNGLRYKWQISEKGVSNHNNKKGTCHCFLDNIKNARDIMAKKVDYVLLTMATSFPDKSVIEDEKIWKIVSYAEYVEILRHLDCGFKEKSREAVILADYIDQLEALVDLRSMWLLDNEKSLLERPFLDEGDAKLKELRIHDLFHKQRYAMICVSLREELSKVLKYYNIELKDRIIIQNGEKECDKKAIVNFGYMHGKPLLDIWLGFKNYVYTIQIQSDAYEHGIQKMIKPSSNNEDNSMSLWNEIWKDGNDRISAVVPRWNWMCPFSKEFEKDGEIIMCKDSVNYFPIVNKVSIFDPPAEVFPRKTRKRVTNRETKQDKYFPYLKYEMKDGLTFIYQYRKISKEATVQTVLDYIVSDYKELCETLFQK